jgi:hypothetical protein
MAATFDPRISVLPITRDGMFVRVTGTTDLPDGAVLRCGV